VAHADEASSVDESTSPRSWLVFKVYLFSLAGLIFLILVLDQTRAPFRGRLLRVSMTVAWCAGLLVLGLGAIRQHRSRFTLRTLALVVAVIAVYVRLCQAVHPVIPTGFLAYAFSVVMLHKAHRASVDDRFGSLPFRGRLSRVIMAAGGLIFFAYVCCLLGVFLLLRRGVL
jgi:hypothetical protein